MDTLGKVAGMTRDLMTGKLIISFMVDAEPSEELDRLSAMEQIRVRADKYTQKRSLNANAYFHLLVGKIATATHSTNVEVKNRLIREYGAYEFIDDQIPTFRLKAQYEEAMLNREDIHVNPIGREYKDGSEWVRFAFMRGSHTYDTQEMSRLIEGTVEEAKGLGIETLTPQEIIRMVGKWRNLDSITQG